MLSLRFDRSPTATRGQIYGHGLASSTRQVGGSASVILSVLAKDLGQRICASRRPEILREYSQDDNELASTENDAVRGEREKLVSPLQREQADRQRREGRRLGR